MLSYIALFPTKPEIGQVSNKLNIFSKFILCYTMKLFRALNDSISIFYFIFCSATIPRELDSQENKNKNRLFARTRRR